MQLASTPASTWPERVVSPVGSGPAEGGTDDGSGEADGWDDGSGEELGEDDTLLLPPADGVPVPCAQPVIRPTASVEASNPTTVR